MTKAKCRKCGYEIAVPPGKDAADFICPEHGEPLEAVTRGRKKAEAEEAEE